MLFQFSSIFLPILSCLKRFLHVRILNQQLLPSQRLFLLPFSIYSSNSFQFFTEKLKLGFGFSVAVLQVFIAFTMTKKGNASKRKGTGDDVAVPAKKSKSSSSGQTKCKLFKSAYLCFFFFFESAVCCLF